MAYVRAARWVNVTFEYEDWATPPVIAGVGLRQSCSAASMLFRWTLADCMAYLHESPARGHGASLDTVMVAHTSWADDM